VEIFAGLCCCSVTEHHCCDAAATRYQVRVSTISLSLVIADCNNATINALFFSQKATSCLINVILALLGVCGVPDYCWRRSFDRLTERTQTTCCYNVHYIVHMYTTHNNTTNMYITLQCNLKNVLQKVAVLTFWRSDVTIWPITRHCRNPCTFLARDHREVWKTANLLFGA
jgi:hypothetical protein